MVSSDVTSLPGRDRAAQNGRHTGGGDRDGPRPGRRRRGTLSRQLIVERAITIIDRDGVAALTMRRLGEDLGVDAMTLYGYVTGRDDLFEAVVAHLVEQIELHPPDRVPDRRDQLGPSQGWQAFLVWTAHSVRDIAVAHPHLFPLIATRPPSAPWLRPPLRSLRLVEDFLKWPDLPRLHLGAVGRDLPGLHQFPAWAPRPRNRRPGRDHLPRDGTRQ